MTHRLNNRKLLYLMLVAGLIAASINAVLFLTGSATGAIPDNLLLPNIRRPLEIGPAIGSSFIPPILAGILLALLNRFTKKPLLVFNVIAVAFLLLSFVTPFSIPKAPVGMIVLLERVGELRKVESRANFAATKQQSHDQTVEAIDRPSMGRNRSGDPVRLFLTLNASANTI